MPDTTSDSEHTAAARPKLLAQVRYSIRRKHYSLRTEDTYVHWIKRFIYFHGKRHPRDLGASEVTAFLNHLSRDRGVAAATQNQALSAVLFLYIRRYLKRRSHGWMGWTGPSARCVCRACLRRRRCAGCLRGWRGRNG